MASVAAGNHETSMRIVDAIFRAMQDAIPERLSAGGATTAGVLFFAEPRSDGSWKMLYEVHGGGEGARHDRAGVSATRVHLCQYVEHAGRGDRGQLRDPRRAAGHSPRSPAAPERSRRRRLGAHLSHPRAVHAPDHLHRAHGDPAIRHAGRSNPARPAGYRLIRQGANVAIDGKSNLVLQQDDLVTIEMLRRRRLWPTANEDCPMSKFLRTGLNAGDSAPITVVGGEGVYFHLEDGRRLIDGSNTGGGLGHRHPAMVEAIRRAADTPVVNEGWTWVGREQAADDLIANRVRG